MNPKYSVGEVVIRQAPQTNYPEANGEYKVEEVITQKQFTSLHPLVQADGDYYYKLSGFRVLKSPSHTGYSYHSSEKFLRKKHEPSQMSFQSIIQNINSPVKQES